MSNELTDAQATILQLNRIERAIHRLTAAVCLLVQLKDEDGEIEDQTVELDEMQSENYSCEVGGDEIDEHIQKFASR